MGKALELSAWTLIKGIKNIIPECPDFIQKLSGCQPRAKTKDVGNGQLQFVGEREVVGGVSIKSPLEFIHPLPSKGEGKALEIHAWTLITGFKNIAPKGPDFIQKIAWLPDTA